MQWKHGALTFKVLQDTTPSATVYLPNQWSRCHSSLQQVSQSWLLEEELHHLWSQLLPAALYCSTPLFLVMPTSRWLMEQFWGFKLITHIIWHTTQGRMEVLNGRNYTGPKSLTISGCMHTLPLHGVKKISEMNWVCLRKESEACTWFNFIDMYFSKYVCVEARRGH